MDSCPFHAEVFSWNQTVAKGKQDGDFYLQVSLGVFLKAVSQN